MNKENANDLSRHLFFVFFFLEQVLLNIISNLCENSFQYFNSSIISCICLLLILEREQFHLTIAMRLCFYSNQIQKLILEFQKEQTVRINGINGIR